MNRMNYIKGICLFVIALFGFKAPEVQAQGMHTTALNLGMGGGGGAYMTGYHANFVNPANLMVNYRNRKVTIGLLGGINVHAGGSLLNIGLWNDHFTTGQIIDAQRASLIANDWFGSESDATASLGTSISVVPIGVSYRGDRFALSAAFRSRVISTTNMSRGAFELVVGGPNADLFSTPKAVNMSTEMLAVGELSVGFATTVWRSQSQFEPGAHRVFAGIAPKFMFGLGYAKAGIDSRLHVQSGGNASLNHEFEYYVYTVGELTDAFDEYYNERRVRNNKDAEFGDYLEDGFDDAGSIQGMGIGFDLGATWEWYRRDVSFPVLGRGPQIIRASISFTDIGTIDFDNNAGYFSANGNFDWRGLKIDHDRIENEFEDFDDYFEHVLEDSVLSDIYGNFSPRNVSSHSVGINPMMNIGGAITMGRLGVYIDVGKGFNDRGINSTNLYTALGTEYNLFSFIPLRFGMRLGGYSGTNLAFGTGLNFRRLEFSASVMTTPDSKNGGANIAGALSGLVLRF